MTIGLLSDNHGYWDERLNHHLEDCDEIWHAGDIGSLEVIDAIKALQPQKARIVFGNIDNHVIRSESAEELRWEIEGIKFFMTHIGGRPGRYAKGVRRSLLSHRPNVFICGHSHLLLVKQDESWGGLYLNPGACGMQGFHQKRTLIKFEIVKGALHDMKVIELGDRMRRKRV